MRPYRSNISAALAIAIERQVGEIIADAKARCALHSELSVHARSASRRLLELELEWSLATALFGAESGDDEIVERTHVKARKASYSGALSMSRVILSLFGLRRRGV